MFNIYFLPDIVSCPALKFLENYDHEICTLLISVRNNIDSKSWCKTSILTWRYFQYAVLLNLPKYV